MKKKTTRREVLQWATPVVVSVALPAHAQTSEVSSSVNIAPSLTGNVSITQILWLQTASNDPNVLIDEFVEIRNDDTVSIDLTGWTISDSGPFTLTFPTKILAPGEVCRIFSHAPQGANTFACEFTFGRTSPGSPGNYVFNNGGDSANLSDSSGTLIDSCSYTPADPNPVNC